MTLTFERDLHPDLLGVVRVAPIVDSSTRQGTRDAVMPDLWIIGVQLVMDTPVRRMRRILVQHLQEHWTARTGIDTVCLQLLDLNGTIGLEHCYSARRRTICIDGCEQTGHFMINVNGTAGSRTLYTRTDIGRIDRAAV